MQIRYIATLLLALSLTACGGTGGTAGSPAPVAKPDPQSTLPSQPITNQYPSYNTSPLPADMTGMTSNAVELAAKMKLGWNIGNTMEAIGGETAWGNPKVTPQLIQAVKKAGFNAIRLPVAWNQYADQKTAKISAAWLARVKQVVQDCVDNDMYVVINIHWDGGWLENNVTSAKQADVNAKQKAFWEQIATTLRDFDEHVLFASANEPNAKDAVAMAILHSYHQTFVNAVRSTGGKNAYRTLVVQGPETNMELSSKIMTMPTDSVPARMMVEVHYYEPSQFAIITEDASWGKMFYYWGNGYHSKTDPDRNATWGEESYVDATMALMKAKFVDKGIPVIVGEYNAVRRGNLTGDKLALHLKSRAHYLNYTTKRMVANGMLPFFWDAGSGGPYGSGVMNRSTNTVFDQQALDALVNGSKGF